MAKKVEHVAIYSRKSRFTGKGESVGNQVELCRAYIRSAFGEECAQEAAVFEDEGFSGGNLNRPGFQRMMQAARERRFQAVVVYRLDRISRNISDFSGLIQELGRLGIDFVSIRENFDTTSPMGRAMMYIASVFSQLERETIAERIRDNMHELAKTGRWLGGVTPTGYTSEAVKTVTLDGKHKRSCRLKLIPEEAELVRRIYRIYGETHSLAETEAELLRQHVKTKTGREFTRFSIKGILQNPVYLVADQEAYGYFVEQQADLFSAPQAFDGSHGILAYHRTNQEKGRATTYLPVSQWIVAVGQHPGIIPSKSWIQAQESLERNKASGYRKPRSNQALLTGLLWCRCGSRMYPKQSQRVTREGAAVYTYVCKEKERSKGSLCKERNVSGNQLDTAVLELLSRLEEDGAWFLTQLARGRRDLSSNREEWERKLEEGERQLAETRRKLSSLVDSLADFHDSDAVVHIRGRMEELHAREEELQSCLRQEKSQLCRPTQGEEELEQLGKKLAGFESCLREMTVEQKRETLRKVIRQVVWDGEQARVMLVGGEEIPSGKGKSPAGERDQIPSGEESEPRRQENPREGPPGTDLGKERPGEDCK